MKKKWPLPVMLIVVLSLMACKFASILPSTPTPSPTPVPPTSAPPTSTPPKPKPVLTPTKALKPPAGKRGESDIYVSIVMHNEEPAHKAYPDFREDEAAYIQSRNNLVEFAEMLHSYGLPLDWQTEWNFLEGVRKWETDALKSNTNGKNVVRYLSEDLGITVEPHSHETEGYNYADVAYLIESLGVKPAPVVGGHIYDPNSPSYQNWPRFQEPVKGQKFPEAVWKADILWGEASPGHKNDPVVSGVWKPKVGDYFTHDENQRLVAVGRLAYHTNFRGVLDLVQMAERGELKAGKIYTIAIFLEQSQLNASFLKRFQRELMQLKELQNEGKIHIVSLPEVVKIWRSKYNSEPNIYFLEPSR